MHKSKVNIMLLVNIYFTVMHVRFEFINEMLFEDTLCSNVKIESITNRKNTMIIFFISPLTSNGARDLKIS